MQTIMIFLEEQEYIELYALLKLAGLCNSGGQAKALIAEGEILRNGAIETRKTAKIHGGEMIEYHSIRLEIYDGYEPEQV